MVRSGVWIATRSKQKIDHSIFIFCSTNRMPFTFPPDVVPGVRSKNTVAMYKSRLNKIASEGYDDVEKLLKTPSKVIKKINEMHDYSDDKKKTKSKRLEMLTAVFYALQNTPADNKKKLMYYKAFQKNKDKTPDEVRKTDPEYKSKKEQESDNDSD